MEELRISSFDSVGVRFKLINKVFGAHSDGGGFTTARNYTTTRDELVSLMFNDVVLLPGNKRFVDLYRSLFYLAINNNLIAQAKD